MQKVEEHFTRVSVHCFAVMFWFDATNAEILLCLFLSKHLFDIIKLWLSREVQEKHLRAAAAAAATMSTSLTTKLIPDTKISIWQKVSCWFKHITWTVSTLISFVVVELLGVEVLSLLGHVKTAAGPCWSHMTDGISKLQGYWLVENWKCQNVLGMHILLSVDYRDNKPRDYHAKPNVLYMDRHISVYAPSLRSIAGVSN